MVERVLQQQFLNGSTLFWPGDVPGRVDSYAPEFVTGRDVQRARHRRRAAGGAEGGGL